MTGSLGVEPCMTDHDCRWLPTGHDGAWPDRGTDGAKSPPPISTPANLNAIDRENGWQPAIGRLCLQSGHDIRLSETPGASVKSP